MYMYMVSLTTGKQDIKLKLCLYFDINRYVSYLLSPDLLKTEHQPHSVVEIEIEIDS